MKLKPATYKHIETEIRQYHETVEELKQIEAEEKNFKEVAAYLSMRRAGYLIEVIHALDAVFDYASIDHMKVINHLYWKDEKVDYVAKYLGKTRPVITKMRDEVIYGIAYKLGWR